jgi:hypothetical protein
MREEIRRAIAVNAAARINKRNPSSVYSYDRGQYASMTPSYDYETGAHIGGSGSSLYHYSIGNHISLNVSGNSFSGYDYDGGHHLAAASMEIRFSSMITAKAATSTILFEARSA